MSVDKILNNVGPSTGSGTFTHDEIKALLAAEGEDKKKLFDRALQVKLEH